MERGDDPLFQLHAHHEHLPRMARLLKPLHAKGKSNKEKICCKRPIHATKKPTAARRDFDLTRSHSLLAATRISSCSSSTRCLGLTTGRRGLHRIWTDNIQHFWNSSPRHEVLGSSRALIPEATRTNPNKATAISHCFSSCSRRSRRNA